MTVLGYEEVLNADFAPLAAAATGWNELAKRYAAVQQRMQGEVLSVTGNPTLWTGYSAFTADQHLRLTLQQTADAQTEAKAVASIIADAQVDFETAQKKLRATVADATADGMKITGTGVAAFDPTTLDPASRQDYGHDRDFQRKCAEAAGQWTQKIKVYLEEATAADQRAALALRRAAAVGPTNEFNGKAVGGGDAADAQRAAGLAEKLKNGGNLTPQELAELSNLMKANSGSPQYSQTLLASLGPEGTLRLADEIQQRMNERDGKFKGEFADLQTNLANTVAGATRDPNSPFYQDFRKGLREAGSKPLHGGASPVYGYQTLATLLQKGNAGYSKEFLVDLGTDVLAADRACKGNWPAHHDGPRPDLVHDPLDSVLGLMGGHPEAATAFLDPTAPGAGDRLAYLLRERDWSQNTPYTLTGGGPPLNGSGPAPSGLAAALEAGATGDVPGEGAHNGGPHTPAQARVMQGIVETLDAEGKGADIPEGLRMPIANALSDYVDDTHRILSEHSSNADRDGAWEENGVGHLGGDNAQLVRVIRGVAEEPEAFATLYAAEQAKAAEELAGIPADPRVNDSERQRPAQRIGTALGAYDAVAVSVILDAKDDRMEWAEKTGQMLSTINSGTTGYFPKVGDSVGALVDAGINQWVDSVKKDAQDTGNLKASEEHQKTSRHERQLVLEWGRGHGYGKESDIVDDVYRSLDSGRTNGYLHANNAMGRNAQK
ncbi:hypothetical protein ACWGB8_23550 [Kitasatospora sp. NPDC054939]